MRFSLFCDAANGMHSKQASNQLLFWDLWSNWKGMMNEASVYPDILMLRQGEWGVAKKQAYEGGLERGGQEWEGG